jgi:hypothetical protein
MRVSINLMSLGKEVNQKAAQRQCTQLPIHRYFSRISNYLQEVLVLYTT